VRPELTCQVGHADCTGLPTRGYLLYARCVDGMWQDASTGTCALGGRGGGGQGSSGAAGKGAIAGLGGSAGDAGQSGEAGHGGEIAWSGAGGESGSP
jgi:hypothetical protein